MREGWHVNWINPGDAGLAPGVAWKLPAGFRAGLLEWPAPERFRSGPLAIFGYAQEVLLVTQVRAPADLAPGSTVELAADVSWLACEEACVPGGAAVSLRLPVETVARRDAKWHARIAETRDRRPSPSLQWNVQARAEDATRLVLDVQTAAENTPPIEGVFFFPFEPGIIENAAAQTLVTAPGPSGRVAYQLRVELSRTGAGVPHRISGVLVSAAGWGGAHVPGAIEIDVPVAGR
jgi:thiol:disulfide interchange protein DsbD